MCCRNCSSSEVYQIEPFYNGEKDVPLCKECVSKRENRKANIGDTISKLTLTYFGVHLVTCPECGRILSHERGREEVKCPSCRRKYDTHECPDLFY